MADAPVNVIVDGWTYGPFYSQWTVEDIKKYFGYSDRSLMKPVGRDSVPLLNTATVQAGTYELTGDKLDTAQYLNETERVKLDETANQIADEILTDKRLYHQLNGLERPSSKHARLSSLQASLQNAEDILHLRKETAPILSSLITEIHDSLTQSRKESPRIKSPSLALSPFHKIRNFDKAVHVAEEIHLLHSLEKSERKTKRKKVLKRSTIPKWGPPVSLRDVNVENTPELVKFKQVSLGEAISRLRSKLSEAMVRTETYTDHGIVQLVDSFIEMEQRQLNGHQGSSHCHGTYHSYPATDVRQFILRAFNVKQ